MVNRIKKLQLTLKAPLIIVNLEDLYYLTGHFLIDGGYLLITKKQKVLFGGYLENVKGIKSDTFKNIEKYTGIGKTFAIDERISYENLEGLKKLLPKIKFRPIASPVRKFRLIKDSSELTSMAKAYSITAKVFAQIKIALRKKPKGWSEVELAQFIKLTGLKLGADDISFPVIVASGENAAVPHHVPTNKIIKPGESVVLDFGFKVDGYCSDFTRTVFIKFAPKNLEEIYLAVEKAYRLAVTATKAGVKAKLVDAAARNYLQTKDYDRYFIHSLGHGTGLEVHEAPSLHQHSEDVLKNGMVFSIEPGIYIPKLGGVRIEDLVYLRNGKVNYFKKVSTKLTDMIV